MYGTVYVNSHNSPVVTEYSGSLQGPWIWESFNSVLSFQPEGEEITN